MKNALVHYPVTHGGIRKVIHPRLKVGIDNQTCVRYLRFAREVTIDHLELPRSVYGRWTPAVPTHPAHLILSVPDGAAGRWRVVKEVDLPYDPRIAGDGLNQEMELAEVEARFAEILKEPPLCIELDGLRTDLLRVECDREHPTWPNHGECNGSPYSVPYGILNGLEAFGCGPNPYEHEFIYQRGLKRTRIEPEAPEGMEVQLTPLGVFYNGPRFSVGFSLKRPMLMHLGWDSAAKSRPAVKSGPVGKEKTEGNEYTSGLSQAGGKSQAGNNRLKADWAIGVGTQLAGISGPLLRTAEQDFGAQHWSGEVAVLGNRLEYRGLSAVEGLSIDAVFTVRPDGMRVELIQRCERPVAALEFETWRFAWDLRQGMTATAAAPTCAPGRNGQVDLPLAWASDGVGCISVQEMPGSVGEWSGQVESFREAALVACGFSIFHPGPDELGVIPAGETRLELELTVDSFLPREAGETLHEVPDEIPDEGLARHWGSVFSCFRPEHRGFSNNAASVNCHLSQGHPSEIVCSTRRLANGLDPADLERFTLKRALLDGGGYGYWRNLYLDSDPALLIAAGRLHQARPDLGWLRGVEAGLREVTLRVLNLRDESGLILCRDLSGNSSSYRWSCNGMDVVGFGHLDAYVNAQTYRGLRCAAALFSALEDPDLAGECREAAQAIRREYADTFLNPETGWIAGWRSRDGRLHDFGFLWLNGPAIAYGLLEPTAAREALLRLEAARVEVGADEGYFGLPSNLYPIAATDHMLPLIWGTPVPMFENYTDGAYNGFMLYYLRALSLYGLEDQAQKLAAEVSYGLAAGYFNGGMGKGTEFHSWDGLSTGYEGTLIGNFSAVYPLAILRGALKPREPEWWPAGG